MYLVLHSHFSWYMPEWDNLSVFLIPELQIFKFILHKISCFISNIYIIIIKYSLNLIECSFYDLSYFLFFLFNLCILLTGNLFHYSSWGSYCHRENVDFNLSSIYNFHEVRRIKSKWEPNNTLHAKFIKLLEIIHI